MRCQAWQNLGMNEKDLIELWNRSRNQLIFAQLAPTFLLITTAGLVSEIRAAGTMTVAGVLGILLASGILGALVEFSAAHEAQAVARDIKALGSGSHISKTIAQTAPWLNVAKFVTPVIFVGIFVALFTALWF
jgi:predicted membrane-bound spermidine synthase